MMSIPGFQGSRLQVKYLNKIKYIELAGNLDREERK
jgi:hypothetical protein